MSWLSALTPRNVLFGVHLHEASQRELSLLRLGQSKLDVVSDLRYLGAQFGFHSGTPAVERAALLACFDATVRRVACLPLSAENKACLIASAPIAKILHGAELSHPPPADLTKLRTTVLRSLWSGRSGRIPEILTTLFFQGHRVDPLQVCLCKPLVTLRRMCLKDADTLALAGRIWRERQQAPASGIQGPVYNVLDSLTQIGWTWTSFDTFSRPFFPPVSWLTCSKNWFAHQVRDGIRHAQLLLAKDRSKHFADYSYIDRHTSLLLLRRLLKQKQSYAHGTFKSIMANAVKTAVIFFKSKLASSSTCPFCDLGVPESTVHMYEECPAWADIRNKFPQAFDARLLTCARLMGIACLEQSTIDVMRSL